ncbi:CLIP domain-containing serine protease [Entomophthora muscae]|uniref:CLIP domain-containing serine protease n=1 Tax=Entomophthora muscae TaxID=34485 RepID=A0ACC2T091_9FUNG|nr:CLIP domain-containing serine protease [Entomophthora muscae]
MKLSFFTLLAFVAGQSRIVGGNEVIPYKYKFVASISHDGRFICGGVFANRWHVITAAHCSLFPLKGYRIGFHRHNLTLTPAQEAGEELELAIIIINPAYGPTKNMNDIAIFRLKTPVQGDIGRIGFDDGRIADKVGKMAIAVGWGWEQDGGPNSQVLREVEIPIVSNQDCYTAWIKYGYLVNKYSHVCAAGQGMKDVCKGDSGGALFTYQDNIPFLVGTTSFGYPCAHKSFPTIFTRTSEYYSFIRNNINQVHFSAIEH